MPTSRNDENRTLFYDSVKYHATNCNDDSRGDFTQDSAESHKDSSDSTQESPESHNIASHLCKRQWQNLLLSLWESPCFFCDKYPLPQSPYEAILHAITQIRKSLYAYYAFSFRGKRRICESVGNRKEKILCDLRGGDYIIPPIPPIPPISGIAGAGLSSLISLIVASVVSSKLDTLTAF